MPKPCPGGRFSKKSDPTADGSDLLVRIKPVATLKTTRIGDDPMKRTVLAAVLTSMPFTLLAPTAMADRGEGPRDLGARMDMMDLNGDGQVTLDEVRGAFAARFAEHDTDGDGSLSQSEMARRAQAKAVERSARRFARLDADGDGEISKAEWPGDRAARMFDRLDANDDDMVSAEELAAARKMHGKRGGKGNGRH